MATKRAAGSRRTTRTAACKLQSLAPRHDTADLHVRVAAVLAAGGIKLTRDLPDYGTIRIPDSGKRAGTGDCAVTVLDDRVLIFGHASGYAPPAVFRDDQRGCDMDLLERRRVSKVALQQRAQREAVQAEKYRRGTHEARIAWNAATPCTNHSYMRAKSETLPGCRMDVAGWLLVPRINVDRNLIALQRIAPKPGRDGKHSKLYWAGAPTTGTFYLLGSIAADGILIACEGPATGATWYHDTGHAVACAMDAGNLLAVCKALRLRYPRADIVIAGDDDRGKAGNPGRTKATDAARAIGGRLAMPIFCDHCDCGATDANDAAHCVRGRVST